WPYNYKYQGQELQEELGLNWYSFKWRNYMPDIGRFFNVDPLSEKYAYQSHYNFAENRVVDGIELEGLEWVSDEERAMYEFGAMIGGGINSVRAGFGNLWNIGLSAVTGETVNEKWVVNDDGSLSLITEMPNQSTGEQLEK